MKEKRINYLWDWSDFSIGFSITKRSRAATGWNYYISVDITFFSIWIYF